MRGFALALSPAHCVIVRHNLKIGVESVETGSEGQTTAEGVTPISPETMPQSTSQRVFDVRSLAKDNPAITADWEVSEAPGGSG